MSRDGAYKILTQYISNQNLIKHHLACEAAMKAIYQYLKNKNPNESSFAKATAEDWGIVGLLHDADYELTKDIPQKHGIVLEEKEGDKIPKEIMRAAQSHNGDRNGVAPQTPMEWAIYCVDELTGLIVAAALIHPDKKLNSISVEFVQNRMKEPSFARGANREMIKKCEEKLGIPLNEFIDITLKSMQTIHKDMGL